MTVAETGVAAAIGYGFSDESLLDTALSHPSYAYEHDGTRGNERLEFLGDAVLDLVVAHLLFETHPDWDEGDLTRTRAGLVNQDSLAARARELGLGGFVRLGRTETRSLGSEKDSILANCFEALVGAIFLDGGLPPVEDFVRRVYGAALERGAERPKRDAKTGFQEWAHTRYAKTPSYRTIGDTGVDNDEERFRVEVTIDDEVWGCGTGRSKRHAERRAAEMAVKRSAETPSE